MGNKSVFARRIARIKKVIAINLRNSVKSLLRMLTEGDLLMCVTNPYANL